MGTRKIDAELANQFTASGGLATSEMVYLGRLCEKYECRSFCEIGRRMGASTRLFAYLASKREGRVVSIDGNAQHMDFVVKKLEELGFRKYVEMVTAFSPWVKFDMEWYFDCLLIDGTHQFIPALVDYHTFNYFVKQGGLIVFHDVSLPQVHGAMLKAAAEDGLALVGRMRYLQVWEKTLPWGRRR